MTPRNNKRSRVSLEEVAKAAGVSKMTASRVLRNGTGFSEETRNKVLQEVERLGYLPNRIAATFGSEQTSTIVGVSVPRLSSTLFGTVLDSINNSLSRLGYQTIIGSHEHDPEAENAWVKNILSWKPAGLILSGHIHTPATIELLKSQAIPVAEIWNLNTSPLDISVGFNHYDCGREMGRFILSKGYQKIGYVGAEAEAPGMGAIRLSGFIDALKYSGTPITAQEILHDKPSFYAGYYGTENLLNRTSNINAIYYQDDAMAIGGMFFCQSKDIKIPSDIGIAGWGGMEVASVLPQLLTTTIVSTRNLGKSAAEALIAKIRGEQVNDITVIPARLAPGNTI